MVPSAGMAIRARDHQAMQYSEIDCSLDVEAEPSTDEQATDHLGAAGLAPQPTEHKIRADADPPQLGKLAAIEARQHDRAPRMPRRRCHQRIQHPGRLDLVPTSQRFDHTLHVPSALAGVLDEIEILVGADLLDPDEHRGAPCGPTKAPRKARFGQDKARRTSTSFSTTTSNAGAEPQHLRAYSTPSNVQPSKLGQGIDSPIGCLLIAQPGEFDQVAGTQPARLIGGDVERARKLSDRI